MLKEFKAIIPDLADVKGAFTLTIAILPQKAILDYISEVWSEELRGVHDADIVDIEIGKRIFSVETNDGYVIPPDFMFPYYRLDPELYFWEKSAQ